MSTENSKDKPQGVPGVGCSALLGGDMATSVMTVQSSGFVPGGRLSVTVSLTTGEPSPKGQCKDYTSRDLPPSALEVMGRETEDFRRRISERLASDFLSGVERLTALEIRAAAPPNDGSSATGAAARADGDGGAQ